MSAERAPGPIAVHGWFCRRCHAHGQHEAATPADLEAAEAACGAEAEAHDRACYAPLREAWPPPRRRRRAH